MTETTERAPVLDLPTLWGWSGWSWIQMETATGIPERELKGIAAEHGFVKAGGGGSWARGPCVRCRKTYSPDDLDETWRCPSCSEAQRSGYRWGAEPRTHREWLAVERIASDYRRRYRRER